MEHSIFIICSSLRTFALIVSAHLYCARRFTCHVMHRARAPSTKMNNDREDGHCYSFAWIWRPWTFGDPYFYFQKHILFTVISTLSKNEQKINVGSWKKLKILSTGYGIMPSCGCKARETMVAKCELVLWGTSPVDYIRLIGPLKVAQNSFQHFPRHRFWWVIITTLHQLMLQSWYQNTVQSLVNTLVLFSWHYWLP